MIHFMSNKSIGEAIHKRRTEGGLSRRALALSIGIPLGYLERLENGGYAVVSPDYLVRIARGLEMTPEDLAIAGDCALIYAEARPDIIRLVNAAMRLKPETVVKWAMGLEANSTCEDCG